MFCQNCGEASQTSDTYCRNCGEYFVDSSNKFNLIYKILGVDTAERQVGAGIIINFFGAAFSLLLMVFLIGYYDAGQNKNPPVETPVIIYFVYAFLIFIAVWQSLGFILGIGLKSKFNNKNDELSKPKLTLKENAVEAIQTRKSLPTANFEGLITPSVAENTTKKLIKESRKN
ncbi:MAG: zinc ribbon domain-containing protein [Acidobacteriota bacterium]|nr:zinc ribbon domain-containing protein [Acidobacteriota bacterium]